MAFCLLLKTTGMVFEFPEPEEVMAQQLVLSGPELDLILELLEYEDTELLVEIRRTDTANFRVGLKERFATVESLIPRIQALVQAEDLALGKRS